MLYTSIIDFWRDNVFLLGVHVCRFDAYAMSRARAVTYEVLSHMTSQQCVAYDVAAMCRIWRRGSGVAHITYHGGATAAHCNAWRHCYARGGYILHNWETLP